MIVCRFPIDLIVGASLSREIVHSTIKSVFTMRGNTGRIIVQDCSFRSLEVFINLVVMLCKFWVRMQNKFGLCVFKVSSLNARFFFLSYSSVYLSNLLVLFIVLLDICSIFNDVALSNLFAFTKSKCFDFSLKFYKLSAVFAELHGKKRM